MVIGALLLIMLARFLGAAEYGRYAFAVSFTGLFAILTDLGFASLAVREIARDTSRASKYFSTISMTKVALSLVTFGLIALIINIVPHSSNIVVIVYGVGLSTIISSFSGLFRSIFRAFEKMEYDSLTNIAERIVTACVALTLLFLGYDLFVIVIGMLIASAVGFLITLTFCLKRFTRFSLEYDSSLAKHLFKMALPIAAAGIMANVMFQTDTIMLAWLTTDSAVGWYNAALRPAAATFILGDVYAAATLPTMSRYFVTSMEKLRAAYAKSVKLLLIVTVPLALATSILANHIILLLYGDSYLASVMVLQILAWSIVFVNMTVFLQHILVSMGRQMISMWIAGLAAVLNVALNYFLIGRFGFTGAAMATLAAHSLVLTLCFVYLQRNLAKVSLPALVGQVVAAALVMGGVVHGLDRLLGDNWPGLLIIAIFAVATYLALLYLLKALDKGEFNALKEAFGTQIAVKGAISQTTGINR